MVPLRFLLLFVALLSAGCFSGSGEEYEAVSFTAQDAARVTELLDRLEDEQGAVIEVNGSSASAAPGQSSSSSSLGLKTDVVLDLAETQHFAALRSGLEEAGERNFRVTNAFLNVRTAPSVQAPKLEELTKGRRVTLIAFPNAAWANVRLEDGREGFVNTGYIAEVVTEKTLSEAKERYEGQYYVDFAFLNVRSAPETKAQKLGELPSQAIIKPHAVSGEWARITFEAPAGAQEAYVATQYLRPFMPSFLVRQDAFTLPILRYRGDEPQVADALVRHLALLRAAGARIMTLREFQELLLLQEEKDVRLPPASVVLAIADVTSASLQDITDALRASDVKATFFLCTSQVGPSGISPQVVSSLVVNGHDVQSAGHGGEDLRALTNAQVALDLAQSRQILEDVTKKDVFAIAYPGGGVNDRIAEQAAEAGYLFGLTLAPGSTFNRRGFLTLPSHLTLPSMTDETLRTLVGVPLP